MLEVLLVVVYREAKPFPIWFYLPWVDNDVSLHILVVLVVVIPTSPRTSKTEFVCKSYCGFRIGLLPVGFGPEIPDLVRLGRIWSGNSGFGPTGRIQSDISPT